MTSAEFDTVDRAFCRRRPFRGFMIEFNSGSQLLVGHPEAVRNEGLLYAMRCPMGATSCSRRKAFADCLIHLTEGIREPVALSEEPEFSVPLASKN